MIKFNYIQLKPVFYRLPPPAWHRAVTEVQMFYPRIILADRAEIAFCLLEMMLLNQSTSDFSQRSEAWTSNKTVAQWTEPAGNANVLYSSLASRDDLLRMMSRNRGGGWSRRRCWRTLRVTTVWLQCHNICSPISQLNEYCQDDWNFRALAAQEIKQPLCLILPLHIQPHVLCTELHGRSGGGGPTSCVYTAPVLLWCHWCCRHLTY